jgi:hypothetical protein
VKPGSFDARANGKLRRVEDFNKAKTMAQQAAKSGAYLYPIKVGRFCKTKAH